MADARIYHLDLRVERARAVFSINDIPLGELVETEGQPETFAPPLNPYLIGRDNMVEVAVYPASDEAELGDAVVSLAVVSLPKGDPMVHGGGTRVASFEIADELRARIEDARREEVELEIPQRFFHLFDNGGAEFGELLRDRPPIGDESALRDYAIVLRDLVRAGNVDALVAEMEPKVQGYARAFDDDADRVRESLRTVLRQDILAASPTTEFDRDDVLVQPVAGGRLSALERPDGRPLISTEPDADGTSFQLPVIAGMHEGALKIHR